MVTKPPAKRSQRKAPVAKKTPAKKAAASKTPVKKRPATPRAPRRLPPPPPSVYVATDALLKTLELDAAGDARAAIARALAKKLDEAGESDSGTIAMATAGIAKELRAVVDSILEQTGEELDFVADLFATVGNSSIA